MTELDNLMEAQQAIHRYLNQSDDDPEMVAALATVEDRIGRHTASSMAQVRRLLDLTLGDMSDFQTGPWEGWIRQARASLD